MLKMALSSLEPSMSPSTYTSIVELLVSYPLELTESPFPSPNGCKGSPQLQGDEARPGGVLSYCGLVKIQHSPTMGNGSTAEEGARRINAAHRSKPLFVHRISGAHFRNTTTHHFP